MPRNFENRTLFHGDNLKFLRGMNSGTIDLIATDPPFNKGRDFHATPDSLARGARFQDRWSWDDDVEQEWVDAIQDDWPGVWLVIEAARGREVSPGKREGEDMAAFLCFMGVRLLEMRRVLKDTGSIYLHCDDAAAAYLKGLMDAIFGRKNLRSQIVWRRYGSHNDANGFGRVYDVLLFYTKDGKGVWNGAWRDLDPDYIKSAYRHDDGDGRGPYRTAPLHTGGLSGGGYVYEFRGHRRTWRYPEERMHELAEDRHIRQAREGSVPERKVYLSENKGRPVPNLWDDIPALTGKNAERTGYPTQKPLALYERIIAASSNEGDWVLDPFAGCATTPVAAERLGRRWVGMDLWDGAHRVTLDRLRQARRIFNPEEVLLVHEPPERDDDGVMATPYLQVTERYAEPRDGSPRTRAAMLEYLLAQHGSRCQGCDREFDDHRYLQLDHNTPRKDGGLNHISNRVLLCGPCNREKGARYTLTGLRERNAKLGYMRSAQ